MWKFGLWDEINIPANLYMILPLRITVRGSDGHSRNSDTGDELEEFCFVIYNCGVIYRLPRVC